MILFTAEECDDMGAGDMARPGAGDVRSWPWHPALGPIRVRCDLVSQSEASIVSYQPIRGGICWCASADHGPDVRPRVMTSVWCCDTSHPVTDTQREPSCSGENVGLAVDYINNNDSRGPRPDYWCDTQMWLFFHHRHDISCGEIWLLRFVYCILVWLSCHGLMISVNPHYFYISNK